MRTLANAGDYHVRYKEAANTTDVIGSTGVAAGNITRPIMGSFKADITGLINDRTYAVWVFRNTDLTTYTNATPLYTGTGTPVAPTRVTLASKSHGMAAAYSITGLVGTERYVVKNETDNSWHSVDNSGDLQNAASIDAAITATISGLTTIGNLNNNKTYNVILVRVFPGNGSLTLADISKNSVANISVLSTGQTLNISSGTGGNAATL
jgi:hypothetical protein